jgi:hypothetical protein
VFLSLEPWCARMSHRAGEPHVAVTKNSWA